MVLLLDVVDMGLTLDRIAAYDFIAIYCEDFGFANKSLNGENGFAFSELSTKRNLIKNDNAGILYLISESGRKMSTSLQSEYAMKYKELMCLIVERYRDYKDVQLLNEISRQAAKSLRR